MLEEEELKDPQIGVTISKLRRLTSEKRSAGITKVYTTRTPMRACAHRSSPQSRFLRIIADVPSWDLCTDDMQAAVHVGTHVFQSPWLNIHYGE